MYSKKLPIDKIKEWWYTSHIKVRAALLLKGKHNMSTLRAHIENAVENNRKYRRKNDVQIRVMDRNEKELFVIMYDLKDDDWSLIKNAFSLKNINELEAIDRTINVGELMDFEVEKIIIDNRTEDRDEDMIVKRYCLCYSLEEEK